MTEGGNKIITVHFRSYLIRFAELFKDIFMYSKVLIKNIFNYENAYS